MSSMMRIFPIISWSKVKKTTEVIILIYIQKQKSFFPVKSTYLFKMLRGLQLQLFLLYNYKFKLYTRSLHNAIFGTRETSHYTRTTLTKTNFTSANFRTTEILRHYKRFFQIWILDAICNHSVY